MIKSPNNALSRKAHALHARRQEHMSVVSGSRCLLSCTGRPSCKFLGAWRPLLCIGHMWELTCAENTCFFVFLGVCFYVRCLGTWEHNSSLCKLFWGLLNFHSLSSQGIQKSSDVLLCRFAWFLCELHQKHTKITMFQEE